MNGFHTLNPFLSVVPGKADSLLQSYKTMFGAESLRWLLAKDGTLAHGEIKIGDAVIGLTEGLPAGQVDYVWLTTTDIECLYIEMDADSDWHVTKTPVITPDHESILMHATDLAGTTWIVQQKLPCKKTKRNGALAVLAVLGALLGTWQLAKRL